LELVGKYIVNAASVNVNGRSYVYGSILTIILVVLFFVMDDAGAFSDPDNPQNGLKVQYLHLFGSSLHPTYFLDIGFET
jgi:hypothetical protein